MDFVVKIKNPGYKKLNIFILSTIAINTINKTVIFVTSINKNILIINHLQLKFSSLLKINKKLLV